jgi:hypothetical protein
MLARAQGRSIADCAFADILVPEFDSVKNYPLTPRHVTGGSSIVLYWKAFCDGPDDQPHKFQNTAAARINSLKRNSHTRGCKICSEYKQVPVMPIRKHHPDVAKEWMERENGFLTKYLDSNSQRVGLFQCRKNRLHIFRCKVKRRTREVPQGCPFCYRGRRLDLKEYPAAFLLYDRTGKNRGYDFRRLPATHYVFWRCPNGHSWYSSFAKVMKHGCKKCQSNHDDVTVANVAELKVQYWASLNGGRSAESILIEVNKDLLLNWRCVRSNNNDGVEHIYAATIEDRLNGLGCPSCKEEQDQATLEQSLANKKYKKIGQEIDREAHPYIDLTKVSSTSREKLSFICSTCSKKWSARIDYRCIRGQGCSSCKAKSRKN